MVGYMQYDTQKYQGQQLEQVMTTIFTCRSIIKYNLSLGDGQKEAVLQDIDASLDVLRTYVQPHMAALRSSQTDSAHVHDETDSSDVNAHETLRQLYHMYYAYLDMNKPTSLQSFVSRFNEVVSVLDDMQQICEQICQPYNSYSLLVQTDYTTHSTVLENLLQKVRVFISDLYYVFMDFIHALSLVLQQNDVQLNTEKLAPPPGR
jgi:hypothetical protein